MVEQMSEPRLRANPRQSPAVRNDHGKRCLFQLQHTLDLRLGQAEIAVKLLERNVIMGAKN